MKTPAQRLQELQDFIRSWCDGMHLDLAGAPSAEGHTVGISFDENFALPEIQSKVSLPLGVYQTKDGSVQVELLGQDVANGLVILNAGDSQAMRYDIQTMNEAFFQRLFEPVEGGEFIGNPGLTD